MPVRQTPLVTGEFYHVVNRGNSSIPIFRAKRNYQRFLETFCYYQNTNSPVKFSKFQTLPRAEREQVLENLKKERDFLVEIVAYCLITNHFHFLLKQNKDAGIFNFCRLLNNSYSRYFNILHKRKGSLFEGRFKAIRIETDEQLLHLSRYIHLNPYSSFVVKDFKNLLDYPFSSLPEYLGKTKEDICNKEIVYAQFSSVKSYQKFVLDQASYQRTLEIIKHQLLEKQRW